MGRARTLATDDILTPAETRIAAGYCEGLIGKEIAKREHISYHTVVRHTQNIYEKAGIRRSTNALVAWFLSRNFRIDIGEVCRSLTGFCLFLVMSVQIAAYTGDQFVRTSGRCRIERVRSKEE